MAKQRTPNGFGKAHPGAYSSWASMLYRCRDLENKDYGGRGITVCQEWQDSFIAFYEDMGDRPEGLSLNRIDNEAGYCKANCEWTTSAEQNINKRNTRRMPWRGELVAVKRLAKRYRIRSATIWRRYKGLGQSPSDALMAVNTLSWQEQYSPEIWADPPTRFDAGSGFRVGSLAKILAPLDPKADAWLTDGKSLDERILYRETDRQSLAAYWNNDDDQDDR